METLVTAFKFNSPHYYWLELLRWLIVLDEYALKREMQMNRQYHSIFKKV